MDTLFFFDGEACTCIGRGTLIELSVSDATLLEELRATDHSAMSLARDKFADMLHSKNVPMNEDRMMKSTGFSLGVPIYEGNEPTAEGMRMYNT